MGRDKALVEVDGRPMAVRVAEALAAAGAGEANVIAVGGDAGRLSAHGLTAVPDRWPGAGPLGGILTALGAKAGPGPDPGRPAADIVLVAGCDLVAPDPEAMAATVAALVADPAAAVATPVLAGRRRWDQAVWRRSRARDALAWQFEAGERAIHSAVAGARLAVVDVHGLAPEALADADTPAELPPV
jgi:molybdopterin-guanine dinucleotide biosynthesis protein A